MSVKMFPHALVACLTMAFSLGSVFAQDHNFRERQAKQFADLSIPAANPDDPVIISVASAEAPIVEDVKPINNLIAGGSSALNRFAPLLSTAIGDRLGSRYRWGATGPNRFDCSGFVWAAFHATGIDFERGSARNLWSRFEVPPAGEEHKFGTLVFFNHLTHVGIVVDEKGFYHASRHHGVSYATFEGYWGKHITGFRRVPLPAPTQKTD